MIKSNPKKRTGRGGGRGGGRGARRVSGGGARAAALGKGPSGAAQSAAAIAAANRARAPVVIPGRTPGGKNQGSKVIVGNLPLDVTESQVKVCLSPCRTPASLNLGSLLILRSSDCILGPVCVLRRTASSCCHELQGQRPIDRSMHSRVPACRRCQSCLSNLQQPAD